MEDDKSVQRYLKDASFFFWHAIYLYIIKNFEIKKNLDKVTEPVMVNVNNIVENKVHRMLVNSHSKKAKV